MGLLRLPLKSLFAGSGLRSAGDGFGLLRTFPAAPAVLGIVIDHVLVPGTVGVEAVVRGADVGSDHFPVWVDLGWR